MDKFNKDYYNQEVVAYFLEEMDMICYSQEINPYSPQIKEEEPYIWGEELQQQTQFEGPVGTLQVQTFTAKQSYPVEGATVVIRYPAEDNREIYRLITDQNGKTTKVQLLAIPAIATQYPNPDIQTLISEYSYELEVSHPKYITMIFKNLPVFEGVNALQPIELIPKSLENSKDSIIINEKELEL